LVINSSCRHTSQQTPTNFAVSNFTSIFVLRRTNNNSVNLDIHFKSKFKTVSYYISSHLFFQSPIPLLFQFSRSLFFLPFSTRWVQVFSTNSHNYCAYVHLFNFLYSFYTSICSNFALVLILVIIRVYKRTNHIVTFISIMCVFLLNFLIYCVIYLIWLALMEFSWFWLFYLQVYVLKISSCW
jgi:hypothetical protein